MKREIDKNPTTPRLSAKAKELLTELCFRKDDDLQKVDGIFVFASTMDIEKLAKLIEKILDKNISKKVFITGGRIPDEKVRQLALTRGSTEANLLLNALDVHRFKDVRFYTETRSTNTLENVTETLKNSEFTKCKSLLFIFKSHAVGRGYLTLRKFFPSARLYQVSYYPRYEPVNKIITRSNWHSFAFTKGRVWGEYLRIKKYSSRGDINYASVEKLLDNIEEEI